MVEETQSFYYSIQQQGRRNRGAEEGAIFPDFGRTRSTTFLLRRPWITTLPSGYSDLPTALLSNGSETSLISALSRTYIVGSGKAEELILAKVRDHPYISSAQKDSSGWVGLRNVTFC